MEEKRNNNLNETGYIESSELLDAIKEEKKPRKKECFLKRLFKNKKKQK